MPGPLLADLLLLDLHEGWAWFMIIGNGLAGLWALTAMGVDLLVGPRAGAS